MDIAITVVSAPSQEDLLLDVAAALQRDFGGALEFRWLAPGEAMDLILETADHPSSCPSPGELASARSQHDMTASASGCSGGDGTPPQLARPSDSRLAGEDWGAGDLTSVKQITAEAVANAPVDWCVQPAARRKKRMLIADMDSTAIGQESIDEMAEVKGIKPEIASITERSMRGELEFESGLRERMQLLRGLTEADLQRVRERLTLNPGVRTLVQTMKAHGAHTVLVSGGFTFFTSAVAARAGFAVNRGNVILWENGRISGIAEPILGREAKAAALKQEAAAHGLSPAEAIAVGDGANDLAMLDAAGLGVAYRAKPIAAAGADAQVRYADLTALLYFQGYRRQCFAA